MPEAWAFDAAEQAGVALAVIAELLGASRASAHGRIENRALAKLRLVANCLPKSNCSYRRHVWVAAPVSDVPPTAGDDASDRAS